jgi:hypothetical protein
LLACLILFLYRTWLMTRRSERKVACNSKAKTWTFRNLKIRRGSGVMGILGLVGLASFSFTVPWETRRNMPNAACNSLLHKCVLPPVYSKCMHFKSSSACLGQIAFSIGISAETGHQSSVQQLSKQKSQRSKSHRHATNARTPSLSSVVGKLYGGSSPRHRLR